VSNDDVKVDAAQMSAWVDRVVDFGIRRPGYKADDDAAKWIEAEFTRAGLKNVRRDPVEVNRWTPDECTVTMHRGRRRSKTRAASRRYSHKRTTGPASRRPSVRTS